MRTSYLQHRLATVSLGPISVMVMCWKLFTVVFPFLMLFEKDEQRLPGSRCRSVHGHGDPNHAGLVPA